MGRLTHYCNCGAEIFHEMAQCNKCDALTELPERPSKYSAHGYWLAAPGLRLVRSFHDGKMKYWRCCDCGKEVRTVYWVTGHDHNDESHHACDCSPNTIPKNEE